MSDSVFHWKVSGGSSSPTKVWALTFITLYTALLPPHRLTAHSPRQNLDQRRWRKSSTAAPEAKRHLPSSCGLLSLRGQATQAGLMEPFREKVRLLELQKGKKRKINPERLFLLCRGRKCLNNEAIHTSLGCYWTWMLVLLLNCISKKNTFKFLAKILAFNPFLTHWYNWVL